MTLIVNDYVKDLHISFKRLNIVILKNIGFVKERYRDESYKSLSLSLSLSPPPPSLSIHISPVVFQQKNR